MCSFHRVTEKRKKIKSCRTIANHLSSMILYIWQSYKCYCTQRWKTFNFFCYQNPNSLSLMWHPGSYIKVHDFLIDFLWVAFLSILKCFSLSRLSAKSCSFLNLFCFSKKLLIEHIVMNSSPLFCRILDSTKRGIVAAMLMKVQHLQIWNNAE